MWFQNRETTMDIKSAFGIALKRARTSKKLTQEDFNDVSSRTFISSLERGKKSITLEKLDSLSKVLNIHPVTLLSMAYVLMSKNDDIEQLSENIKAELYEFLNSI